MITLVLARTNDMKYLKLLQSKIKNKVVATATIVTAFLIAHPACSQERTLTKAKQAMTAMQTEVTKFVPVVATVILLCLAIGYAGRYIGKTTFIRWAVGITIAGSAVEITKILYPH
ncbi:VirB2 family type IV secretion system major pilin TrwL [Bartonella sp. B41]